MRWTWLMGLLLLLGCKSNDLSMLKRESLLFRGENERIRADDLEATYRKHKQRADELSNEVLRLAEERERLYEQYDKLMASIASARRRSQQGAREHADLQRQLKGLQAETAALLARIEKERKAQAELQLELEDLEAKRRALGAKKRGLKAPE